MRELYGTTHRVEAQRGVQCTRQSAQQRRSSLRHGAVDEVRRSVGSEGNAGLYGTTPLDVRIQFGSGFDHLDTEMHKSGMSMRAAATPRAVSLATVGLYGTTPLLHHRAAARTSVNPS